MVDIGRKIRVIRQAKNMSLQDLSDLTGISQPYLSMLENGERKSPSSKILNKIVESLNIQISQLYDIENDKIEEVVYLPTQLHPYIEVIEMLHANNISVDKAKKIIKFVLEMK